MKRLAERIKKRLKEGVRTKLRKKAAKKLKKLIRKLVCTAVIAFGLVMVYKHRRPIIAAILGKKHPAKKCPVFRKR